MKIDYENGRVTAISKSFSGITENGIKFTVYATSDTDEWFVDSVGFENEDEREEELEEEIARAFLLHMNG